MDSSAAVPRWQRWWTAPRLRDCACVLLSALLAVATAAVEWQSGSIGYGNLVLTVGLGGSLVLWWRRRWPLEVTVVGGILMLAVGFPGVALLGLFTLAVRRRDRVLVIATVVTAACLALPHPWSSTPWRLADTLTSVALTAAFALWGSYVGARRDLIESLRERAVRAEAERELRATQARTAERSRIAREMHDVLAHRVSLIALQAGALEVNAGAASDAVERAAAEIRSTAHETLEDLRGVLGVLRGSDAEPLAPQPDLRDLARLAADSRVGGTTVDLEIDECAAAPHAVPEALGRTAYRIVQESLTNVRKHAGPAAVRVAVRLREHRLSIEVVNDRPRSAAPPLPGSGSGLIGLAERVQLAGGEITSGPTGTGGWRVFAELPVPAERA
ncbi:MULTISPECIES: sensor histidine kinase [Tsukamurella]|uniref:histidine kinase n=2 Tax=Tsukamurella TaxID=2060 RepID=A0A5C5RZD3_9ACTN|nr:MULTISPECIES: histidine kinase [Tsukamurella]NMD54556.1 two-component sensor histidine kinase [Tsukamurella columbiensis]TWS28479.1 two-component sensor histidine kinase [Tsukamurella conjunctivitidis]